MTPIATYRLQLTPEFTLDGAAALVPYLAGLGVSHVYSSPILQAAPGSQHGYDVVDPTRISEELGGARAHERFVAAMRRENLAHLLDIVPNHMATVLPENRWWWDVLEKGRASRYAEYFDLYWSNADPSGSDTLVLAVLGEPLAEVLKKGELKLVRRDGALVVQYYEHVWPLSPNTVRSVLDDNKDPEAAIARLNGDPEALGKILDRQCYRLAYWRLEREPIGYRRFFDVTTLIGVRVEEPRVFAERHQLLLELYARGEVQGIRIDHVDGLRDPESYLHALAGAAPDAWMLVEKILGTGECLRESWPVAGTTGYDFLSELDGLFVDPRAEHVLSEIYASFTGESTPYADLVREKKLLVERQVLAADVQRLTELLAEVSLHRRLDATRQELIDALEEVVAAFPVYRSYTRAEAGVVHEDDRSSVEQAVEMARVRRPDLPPLFGLLSDLLLLEVTGDREADFVARFQQLTGPAMAKGVEDTAFYCFGRLLALNEVGGNPGRFGISVNDFHRACGERQEKWPLSLLASTTHDTKRGEDARARISLLSELPADWRDTVERWTRINERHRTNGLPDRSAEYFFYQTLVGSFPISVERATAYMEKASREAKVHTSWRNPNPDYDAALRAFVEGALGDAEFVADLRRFLEPLVPAARIGSLARTLIKMTAPGVPDIYQGSELWDERLVDPDNRAPVDFDQRAQLLAELDALTPERVLERMEQGAPKLRVIQGALRVRREHASAFDRHGTYQPVFARGPRAEHVVAFARGTSVLSVVPRLVFTLGGEWSNTNIELPAGSFRNAFTSECWHGSVPMAELFARFPVALLTKDAQAVGLSL